MEKNFDLNTLMYIYVSFVLYFTMMPIVKNIPFMINHFIYHFGSNMNMNLFDDETKIFISPFAQNSLEGYVEYLLKKYKLNPDILINNSKIILN